MPIWTYRGISLELEAVLVCEGQRYTIPTYKGEGWGHAFLKIVVAAHLLSWGYPWEKIHWEQSPPGGPRFRPDIYTEAQGALPSFWFECRDIEEEKLRRAVALLSNFRIVRVMNYEELLRWWNGECILPPEVVDKCETKKIILQHRQETSIPGVEYWGIMETSMSARILFALRRERSGQVTYLDTGEGWSVPEHIRCVSKRKDQFQPLIPGIVEGDRWWRWAR